MMNWGLLSGIIIIMALVFLLYPWIGKKDREPRPRNRREYVNSLKKPDIEEKK